METRRHFTKEFKLEAVRLLEHSGRPGAEIARELGIRRNQLYKWAEQLKGKGATRAFLGSGPRRAAEDELTRLKRELAQVTEERDILKKAAAFFARHSA
jgi:transposase